MGTCLTRFVNHPQGVTRCLTWLVNHPPGGSSDKHAAGRLSTFHVDPVREHLQTLPLIIAFGMSLWNLQAKYCIDRQPSVCYKVAIYRVHFKLFN